MFGVQREGRRCFVRETDRQTETNRGRGRQRQTDRDFESHCRGGARFSLDGVGLVDPLGSGQPLSPQGQGAAGPQGWLGGSQEGSKPPGSTIPAGDADLRSQMGLKAERPSRHQGCLCDLEEERRRKPHLAFSLSLENCLKGKERILIGSSL